jgi:hypothetical protein
MLAGESADGGDKWNLKLFALTLATDKLDA